MNAPNNCPTCGNSVNSKWNRVMSALSLLLIFMAFIPLTRIWLFKGDYTKDLKISEISKQVTPTSIDITGLITNGGNKQWSSVRVEAEFFAPTGQFVTEDSSYISADIQPKGREYFKISVRTQDLDLKDPNMRMDVKIGSAISF